MSNNETVEEFSVEINLDEAPDTVEEALEELTAEGGLSTKKLIAAGVLVVALIGMGVSFWRLKKAKDVLEAEVAPIPIDDVND
jgi:hypothetical protein